MRINILTIAAALVLTACGGNTDKRIDAAAEADEKAATEAQAEAPGAVEIYTAPTVSPDPSRPTIVDFNAAWCGPCRMFGPIFDATAEKYKGKARFLSVDVDKAEELARAYGVNAIPQVTIIYSDGTSESRTGLIEQPEFEALVGAAIASNNSRR